MNEHIFKSLNEIHKVLESYSIERAKTELYDANRFNPFQFIETDENGLSRILAFFLDPIETHGQQDLFLNTFLKYLKLHQFLSYDHIVVTCEKLTKTKRRHDIFIEGWLNSERQWVVSIENKLKDAKDQGEQLSDYHKDLITYKVPFFLIYLPPFKRQPTKESISEDEWKKLNDEHKATVLGTKDIIKWLNQTPILAPNINNFCNDFKQFLKEKIMREVNNNDDFLDKIIQTPNWLSTAISLIENSENLYERLDVLLIQQLQKELEDKYPEIVSRGWKFNTSGHSTGFYLDKGDIEKQSWGIGIEFDSANCKDAYYGVWAHKFTLSKEKYDQLNSIFKYDGFKNTKSWLYWKWCDDNLKNWNAETWRKVTTGELANKIFELFHPFIIDIKNHLNELEQLPCK